MLLTIFIKLPVIYRIYNNNWSNKIVVQIHPCQIVTLRVFPCHSNMAAVISDV